jgi:hypothetical protein
MFPIALCNLDLLVLFFRADRTKTCNSSADEVSTWNVRPKIPLSFNIVPGKVPSLGSFAGPCAR